MPLGNFPKLHSREKLTREARRKLLLALVEATKGLTMAETVSVVTDVLSNEVLGQMKYAIRMERHGDTETPGGLEKD